jgi:hypothetical protein
MQQTSPLEDHGWSSLVSRLSADIDLRATAHETKAFIRARGVPTVEALLRLALIYGVSGLSLRSTAAWAEQEGIAKVSDVSLLDRLRNSADWLELLWQAKLSRISPPVTLPKLGLAVRLVDATTISAPGNKTAEWRLHMDYRPLEGRFGAVELTDGRGSEGFHRFAVKSGELLVGDRGYAKANGLRHIRDADGHFLVRIGWRSVVLLDKQGADLDILATLASLPQGQTTTLEVQLASDSRHRRPVGKARLILSPLPEEAAAQARKRVIRKAQKQSHAIQPKGVVAANWLMLLTSVEEERASADQVVALYRLRWQIELAFKRLKSQLHMDRLTADDPLLARSWIAANLLVALMARDMDDAPALPPCAPG